VTEIALSPAAIINKCFLGRFSTKPGEIAANINKLPTLLVRPKY
jgi:hypothetical protein